MEVACVAVRCSPYSLEAWPVVGALQELTAKLERARYRAEVATEELRVCKEANARQVAELQAQLQVRRDQMWCSSLAIVQ